MHPFLGVQSAIDPLCPSPAPCHWRRKGPVRTLVGSCEVSASSAWRRPGNPEPKRRTFGIRGAAWLGRLAWLLADTRLARR